MQTAAIQQFQIFEEDIVTISFLSELLDHEFCERPESEPHPAIKGMLLTAFHVERNH
jgi:hypothetical protein